MTVTTLPADKGNVAGIDPHKRTLTVTVTVLDQQGGTLGTRSFKAPGEGHRAMEAWTAEFGPLVRVGVEGASALGRHTAVFLCERGYDVRDVCPDEDRRAGLPAPARQDQRPRRRAHRPRDPRRPPSAEGVQAGR